MSSNVPSKHNFRIIRGDVLPPWIFRDIVLLDLSRVSAHDIVNIVMA